MNLGIKSKKTIVSLKRFINLNRACNFKNSTRYKMLSLKTKYLQSSLKREDSTESVYAHKPVVFATDIVRVNVCGQEHFIKLV